MTFVLKVLCQFCYNTCTDHSVWGLTMLKRWAQSRMRFLVQANLPMSEGHRAKIVAEAESATILRTEAIVRQSGGTS